MPSSVAKSLPQILWWELEVSLSLILFINFDSVLNGDFISREIWFWFELDDSEEEEECSFAFEEVGNLDTLWFCSCCSLASGDW